MALRTPPRPVRAAPAPRRGSGGGKLIVVLLVVVALGVGYLAVAGKLPGLPQSQPTAQTLPAESFNLYGDFWNHHTAAVPPEFSVAAVTGLANDCVYGAMPRNTPHYLDADQLGRARGGYVCLVGPPTGVPHLQCPAPGTNDWWDLTHPGQARSVVARRFIVHGHIIGKSLGGDGSATDSQGRCVNIVPQSATPNSQMGIQAERRAKDLATAQEAVPVFYVVVAPYGGQNHMPIGMFPFIFSPSAPPTPIGPFLNETDHIALAGSGS